VAFLTCETDPLTGKRTLALISDDELFAASREQYKELIDDYKDKNKILSDTDNRTKTVKDIGKKIEIAAEKWYISIGQKDYLKNYKWEYNVVDSDEVNAWCMPGGKIVFYTGILPLFYNDGTNTINESMLATVMGHEVSHALLNHGKQRVSLAYLQQLGLVASALTAQAMGADDTTLSILLTALGIGSNLGVALPFSRDNESEADHYGLILMAIAGYDPEQSVLFWQKMAALGSSTPEFLSTHPSHETRIRDLSYKSIPEAKTISGLFLIDDYKYLIPKAKKIAAEINGF